MKKRSKKAGHKLVFSIRPETSEIFRLLENGDELLLKMVDRVLCNYVNKFYQGDSIGYLAGIHHDRQHLHVHVILFPQTEKGRPLNVSHPSRTQVSSKGESRPDYQGFLKATAAEVFRDVYREHIVMPVLSAISQKERERYPIYKCDKTFFDSRLNSTPCENLPTTDQPEQIICLPPECGVGRPYFHDVWPSEDDRAYSLSQKCYKVDQDLEDIKFFKGIIWAAYKTGSFSSDDQEWVDRRCASNDPLALIIQKFRGALLPNSRQLAYLSPEALLFQKNFDQYFGSCAKDLDQLYIQTNTASKNLKKVSTKITFRKPYNCAQRGMPAFPAPMVDLPLPTPVMAFEMVENIPNDPDSGQSLPMLSPEAIPTKPVIINSPSPIDPSIIPKEPDFPSIEYDTANSDVEIS